MRAGRARAKSSIASSNDCPIRALGARPTAVGGPPAAVQTCTTNRIATSLDAPASEMAYPVAPSTEGTCCPALDSQHTTRRSAIPTCALPRAARHSTMVYRPRRPEKTVIYQLVQEHLETWLARVREAEPDGDPIPRFVERDLRKYLEGGILAHGFGRARYGGVGVIS